MVRVSMLAVALFAFVPSDDCTFLRNPDEFHRTPEQRWRQVSERTGRVAGELPQRLFFFQATAEGNAPMPRRNFIDEHIFGRMERDGIVPAPLSTDQEFLRRVFLDLTGRIPTADQVSAFLSDTNPAKRDVLIDSLVAGPEFIDKWTMFFGDLFRNNGPATNVNRFNQGRDAFYRYIKDALTFNKPYTQIAFELISANGDTFIDGAANFPVGGTVPMGPVQDTYDGQANDVAQMFLGINTVDCLLCHDGNRHLDTLNLWASQQTRAGMWGLSAFFARTHMQPQAVTGGFLKYIVSDAPAGDYELNTTTGNRSPRMAADVAKVTPQYPFTGETPEGSIGPRQALGFMVAADPQFARAAVNYIWEQFMVEALVSPSNAFDLARLDPENPPPAPWTLQPNNPELLAALASWFQTNGYDLRQLMALIVKSNAYQLSSAYSGVWRPKYVPYYARKYARRLYAEEIHDAVTTATGILPRYTLDYQGAIDPLPPVSWAMQLPDTREPRNNQATQFLNAFGRGDRDLTPRETTGSLLQALNMMNQAFVMTRIHENNNGSNVQRLLKDEPDPRKIIEGLYLATLSRFPDAQELTVASELLRTMGNPRGAEALQWALLNKTEFIFNY